MLGQIYKAKTQGLRIKPTYDDIIEETFKPVKVKYPDRRAEATFNSHLFGQIRDAIDETENANQIARLKELGMRRAAAQSGQSFNSVAASIPPQPVASVPPPPAPSAPAQPAPSVPPQPAPSPIIVDYDLERERFLQEETQAAQQAVREAMTQRERTTQQAREQLQYIANESAAASLMDQQRQLALQDSHAAEIRDLQTRESNASWSLVVQERNAERALRRQAEDNQVQAAFLATQLRYLQQIAAEENQMQATFLRGSIQDEYIRMAAAQRLLPVELRDEVSSQLAIMDQLAARSSSSSSSSSSSAAAAAGLSGDPLTRDVSNESAASDASTKSETKSVKKTIQKKEQQHSTKIEQLTLTELLKKPRQYLVDQLDLRKVVLTKTERKKMTRNDLADRIKASDTALPRMTKK